MTRGESRSTPVPAGVLSAMMSGTPMTPLSSVTCLVLQGNELHSYQVTHINLKFNKVTVAISKYFSSKGE